MAGQKAHFSFDLKGRALALEGQISRESSVSEGLVNRRWAQLYGPSGGEPPVLVSFRRQGDPEPSKVWVLTRQCSLSQPKERHMRLRVNTSTLMAHWHSTPVEMVSLACLVALMAPPFNLLV